MKHTITSRTPALAAGFWMLTLFPAPSRAARQRGSAEARPVLAAVRLEGRAPRIDGRIDEAAWACAHITSGFRQYRPRPGAPASQSTKARVLYDDESVCVAIRARTSPVAA